MNAALGIDAGYLYTRVGALTATGPAVRTVSAGEDPFAAGEALLGGPPSVVAIPGGPPEDAYPWHPLNILYAAAARHCAEKGIPCVRVLPMSSAALLPEARLSGFRDCERQGLCYAVPQRAAFEKAAEALGIPAAQARVITVYLGDEVAVSAHCGAEVVDTSDPVTCEGPFGLTSAGTAPATAFVASMAASGVGSVPGAQEQARERLKSGSGAFAYAGVSSLAELSSALSASQEGALSGVLGMAYQVAKEIGRQAAALKGKMDAIALCGPGAALELLTEGVRSRAGKWAKVLVFDRDLTMPYLLLEGTKALSQASGTTPLQKGS